MKQAGELAVNVGTRCECRSTRTTSHGTSPRAPEGRSCRGW